MSLSFALDHQHDAGEPACPGSDSAVALQLALSWH
jgi:hypothetical protein